MKTLLVLDRKNYSPDMKVTERYCVRAIIIRNGRIAVQKSAAGDYKLLGGGMEKGEPAAIALDREVREEAGLMIRYDSIQPLGEILEKRRDLYDPHSIYICHTDFYLCEIESGTVPVNMTESEIAKGFHMVWTTPAEFVRGNAQFLHQPWTYRDTEFVKNYLSDMI